LDRSRNALNREDVVVFLVCGNAQKMIRVGMTGIDAQNLATETLRSIDFARLMVLESGRVDLGDRGHLSFLARCRRIHPAH
jgi:hypothetical protein